MCEVWEGVFGGAGEGRGELMEMGFWKMVMMVVDGFI